MHRHTEMPAADGPRDALLSAQRLGGKAAMLLELQQAGFRVPELHVSPQDLPAVVRQLGFPIAVRSSATVEDGSHSSFAGQFRSFLDLLTLEDVQTAVAACRESLRAPSVIEYCRKHGINPQTIRMEVIVQRMLKPELAGVAFSVDPITGADEVVIEACGGVAEALLAGRARPLPAEDPLLEQYRPLIEGTVRRIQRHFGAPQDVEFAVEHGTVYVLQSRPITRITFGPDIGEWTNADFRDGGVSSTVCTPLMWSLYDLVWESALNGFCRDLLLLDTDFQAGRMFFGRPYWNLGAVKQCLAKVPGFVEREFDQDLSIAPQYEGDGITTPVTLRGIIKTVPTAIALLRFFRRQEVFDRRFLSGGFDSLASRWESVPDDIDSAFRVLIERDYYLTELNYFRTIYCAVLAKQLFLESFPEAEYPALIQCLPELRHMAPIRALRQIGAQGERDVTPILEQFRHHSRRELDLRAPRWDEDREFVEQLLESFRNAPGPSESSCAAYKKVRTETRAAAPWYKHRAFDKKLDRMRRFVWLREEMRDLSSRMYYLIRKYVLEIAERRGLGDDIFFMTYPEILADDRSNIERNREVYDSYRNFAAPNEIGARFSYDNDAPAEGLTGIAASRGRVTGPARVVRTVEEALTVERGAVMICPFTDPGWTPVLERVAAVVTETGGMLSHAAIICREYGIPAVLGVERATERIPDYREILVDADRGYVSVVD